MQTRKSKKKRNKSKLTYEAVDSGRAGGGRFGTTDSTVIDTYDADSVDNTSLCSVMIHSRCPMGKRMIRECSHCYEEGKWPLFIQKYECPLSVMCFATGYKNITLIATDERVIPAISYLMFHDENGNAVSP